MEAARRQWSRRACLRYAPESLCHEILAHSIASTVRRKEGTCSPKAELSLSKADVRASCSQVTSVCLKPCFLHGHPDSLLAFRARQRPVGKTIISGTRLQAEQSGGILARPFAEGSHQHRATLYLDLHFPTMMFSPALRWLFFKSNARPSIDLWP